MHHTRVALISHSTIDSFLTPLSKSLSFIPLSAIALWEKLPSMSLKSKLNQMISCKEQSHIKMVTQKDVSTWNYKILQSLFLLGAYTKHKYICSQPHHLIWIRTIRDYPLQLGYIWFCTKDQVQCYLWISSEIKAVLKIFANTASSRNRVWRHSPILEIFILIHLLRSKFTFLSIFLVGGSRRLPSKNRAADC